MSFGFGLGFPRVRSASLEAAIAGLFPDVWYDPSDFTTLFTDAAGTTPVTALEQPVGLMLDKSRGLVLGAELVTNGDFATDTAWTKNTGWTISGGQANFVNAGSTAAGLLQSLSLTAGKFYKIIWTPNTTVPTANVLMQFVGGSATTFYSGSQTAGQSITVYAAAGTGNNAIQVYCGSGLAAFSIDNISVRELPGAHAYHTPGDTTTRPVVSRRINLLTKTEDFADAAWTVKKNPVYGVTDANGGANAVRVTSDASSQVVLRQSNYTIVSGVSYTHRLAIRRVTGTGTIHVTSTSNAPTDVTSQVSSAWAYVTVTGVNPQASGANGYFLITLGTSGDSIEVCFPSAVPADLAALPYQRVNTTTDYDSDPSKFPTFLRTDGVNDSLQTNAIDFTATDKMFVGAAVRKLSDATQIFAEFSSAWSAATGTFASYCDSSGTQQYASAARGTATPAANQVASVTSGYAAPNTSVFTSSHDIAGDLTALRLNGAAQTSATGDKGAGNFGNYKLYLFMRGGTSLPANIWFFGSLIKGATLSASQIALAERWLASKTKTVVLA